MVPEIEEGGSSGKNKLAVIFTTHHMNILQTAIRRILVRNVDKTISTIGRNAAYDMADYKPSLPTVSRLITNVIWFGVLTYSLSSIFAFFNIQLLAYITPLFFIGRIFRPLAYNHVYGQKQEPVLVRDRRFRSGARTEGYRWVKDKDKKYDFTPEQIKISKSEGLIKLLIAGLIVFNVHSTVTSTDHRQSNLNKEEVLRLLQPGDTVFSKSSKVDILVKVKETSYRTGYKGKREVSYETVSYKTAFADSLKILGLFIAKDTTKTGLSYYTYLSISSFNANGWLFTNHTDTIMNKEITRADSLFYIELSDATVSPSKLPPIKGWKDL